MHQAFDPTFRAFLAELFALEPVFATGIGDHTHDGSWPDLSPSGRAARLDFVDRWATAFGAMDALSEDEAIDRDLIVGELDAMRFAETELQEMAWDPLTWVYLMGSGIFSLLARDFAPLADRLASVAGRLEEMAGLTAAATMALVGADGRLVGRFQTEKAIERLGGIGALVDEALTTGEAAPDDAGVVGVMPRLRAAAAEARAALAAFEEHLRSVVLPASDGDGRLGRELFARKMRHTMRSDELTPERVLARAEAEFEAVRAEMIRLARLMWTDWCPGTAIPGDDQALVRGVLDAIAAEHQPAEALLDFCRAETLRIEAFCRETDLIGLTDEPMEIRWTPAFLRSFGGAMLISPGPLERGQTAFFAITPMPDDWTDEQRTSYLREDNDRMLRLLSIHEAVPGHYLQGVYANRCPSLPRAIFSSGLFAEGWAVYVTQVMMDAGYGADDPALLLTHWKFYLRAITNAIIDARIHVDGMTEEEAVAFMVDGGFQERAEARAKYDRARLSSTQLSTYFAGSMEFWDIEVEARRSVAEDRSIAAGRLPGGFGETPGFRYREHLERVLAFGTPPTATLKRILGGSVASGASRVSGSDPA